jgi:sec-independent protein translocase protein TatC
MATALRPISHDDRLSLVEHLDELRTRIILSLVVFVGAFAVCFWQNDRILDIMDRPLEKSAFHAGSQDPLEKTALFAQTQKRVMLQLAVLSREMARSTDVSPTLRKQWTELSRVATVSAAAAPKAQGRRPVTLGVGEPFTVTFRVVGYAALLLSLPFLLYQAYAFVLPAFSPRERKVAMPLMLMVPFLFVAGAAFGYFVALPRAIDFLQNFNDDNFDILIRATDYYKFSIVLIALIGLLFQIPVGVLAVTRLGIVSARQLARSRGYVILGISVVAAVATPTPDPVTMLVAMAPLLVLFELSVLLARILERRRVAAGPDERWDLDDDLSLS